MQRLTIDACTGALVPLDPARGLPSGAAHGTAAMSAAACRSQGTYIEEHTL
ncbi:MAG: hypothetical protein OEQ39_26795 [Gammaproteobacteria bacterium]|nr:hypothetical protein [Gammaproteobacteria bacterium]